MKNRVVITGMGAVTPIGNTEAEFWENAKSGKLGIDTIKSIDIEGLDVKFAGEVKNLDIEKFLDKKECRRLDKFTQYALIASMEAVENAKLDLNQIDKDRFAVIVGSGIGGFNTNEKEFKTLHTKGIKRISPMYIPMTIINAAAANIAIKFGARGMCTSVVTACATGTNSIGDAYRHIKDGYADIAITGGCESSITPIAIAGFTNMRALSTSKNKTKASIPFDKERGGFVMGEGAGILVIESLEHAKKRGANILAEIVGYGSTCDAYHITSPSPEGVAAANAMKNAVKEANVKMNDVSYINAHGTSTYYNDLYETRAIKNAFGEDAKNIPISSTKSMIGHLLGAAGAVESIICVRALNEGFIPPTIGYTESEEELDLDYVPNKGRCADLKYALNNSLGFGGHNACLLFKKWD